MLTDWDYTEVQSFDALKEIWETEVKNTDTEDQIKQYGNELRTRLGLRITDLDAEQSAFFKHHYQSQFKNKGIMVRE
jgi:peptidoglycan hydrolase-like amidase